MPRVYRLSKKFSDRFGEDLADEMVSWFNEVDTAYRTELREWNERNWQRFDARLEHRLAEVKAELRTEMQEGFARVRADMSAFKAELIKWMFLFWLGTVATNVALIRLMT